MGNPRGGSNNHSNANITKRKQDGNDSERNGKGNKAKNKNGPSFYGDTREMNGPVFQVRSEQTTKGQFLESVDHLKIYSSINRKKEIRVLTTLFDKLKTPTIPEPVEPVATENVKSEDGKEVAGKPGKFQEAIYNEEIKQWLKDKRSLDSTLVSLFNIVWGQCSKLMRNKLIGMDKYEKVKESCDVATLLKEIRRISNRMEENTSIYDALDQAKQNYYKYEQPDDESNARHLINFKNIVGIVEHYGGELFYDEKMIEHEMNLDS